MDNLDDSMTAEQMKGNLDGAEDDDMAFGNAGFDGLELSQDSRPY